MKLRQQCHVFKIASSTHRKLLTNRKDVKLHLLGSVSAAATHSVRKEWKAIIIEER